MATTWLTWPRSYIGRLRENLKVRENCRTVYWRGEDMGYLMAYAVAFGSLLAGATVVHHIYNPDLVTLGSCCVEGIPAAMT